MSETVVPPPRLGRCLNEKRCSLADSNAHIPLADDAPLTCPECKMSIVVRPPPGKPQIETEAPRPKLPRRLIVLGSVVAVMIGAGVAFDLFNVKDEERPDAAPPGIVGGNVMMFTLGATSETRDTLAPALAAAFMAERGCSGFAEERRPDNRMRLLCTSGVTHFFIDIAPAEASTAFDAGERRPIDVLITAASVPAKMPRDATTIGFGAAALIVNPANPVRGLSVGEAAAIMNGSVDSFAKVGGSDTSIRRIAPGDRDPAVTSFAALAPGGGRLAINTRRLADSVAVANTVAGDPDALGLVNPLAIGGDRALAIGDGDAAVPPSLEAISAGRYPLASRLKIEIPRGSKVRYARPFADFAASAGGQVHVRSAGYLPLPPDQERAARPPAAAPPPATATP